MFDEDKNGNNASHILDKRSGKTTPIRLNGVYEFDFWFKDQAKYNFNLLAKDDEEEVDTPPAAVTTRTRAPRGKTILCGDIGCRDENCTDKSCLDFHRHT